MDAEPKSVPKDVFVPYTDEEIEAAKNKMLAELSETSGKLWDSMTTREKNRVLKEMRSQQSYLNLCKAIIGR